MNIKKLLTIIGIIIIGLLIFYFSHMQKQFCLPPGELPEIYIHEIKSPQYDKNSFTERRQRINNHIKENVLIISTAAGNDFYYLTGFDEREGIAILNPSDAKQFIMFVTPRNPADAMWTGERHGVEGAIEIYEADTAYTLNQFEEVFHELIKNKNKVFLHSNDVEIKSIIKEAINKNKLQAELKNIDSVIHESRVIKDQWEIEQIKQAVAVTGKAHSWIMQTMAPGQKEYEIQAEIEYIFRKNGLKPGFSSIVGSGPNAAILHHIRNDRIIKDNELVLVDIGAASLGGYSADITRTYPVNGKFTPEQREIYNLVYEANEAGIKKMKPGYKMLDCNHKANRILVDGLHKMGLIPDTTVWWQKRFYIQHRVNHYIGLDVHDAGAYGFDPKKRDEHILTPEIRGRKLKPGMVLTIEPGVYLQPNRLDYLNDLFGDIADKEALNAFAEKVRPIYEKYAGIGVRIEDNILITETGNINLSKGIPKTADEIESAMKKQLP